MIRVTFEIEPGDAAALKRLLEKTGHEQALGVLYGHRPRHLRDEQASQIIRAVAVIDRALEQANVRSWPWVETGQTGEES